KRYVGGPDVRITRWRRRYARAHGRGRHLEVTHGSQILTRFLALALAPAHARETTGQRQGQGQGQGEPGLTAREEHLRAHRSTRARADTWARPARARGAGARARRPRATRAPPRSRARRRAARRS